MKFPVIVSLSLVLVTCIATADAQTTPPARRTPADSNAANNNRQRGQFNQADLNAPATKYSYYDAFAPFFYTKNGSDYRAATGEPGSKYWQNRADYQLAAKYYPFSKRRYQMPTGKNVKKALPLSDIGKIFHYTTRTPAEEKAKAFWLFSYFANGMNMTDVANLRYKNLSGEFINF